MVMCVVVVLLQLLMIAEFSDLQWLREVEQGDVQHSHEEEGEFNHTVIQS